MLPMILVARRASALVLGLTVVMCWVSALIAHAQAPRRRPGGDVLMAAEPLVVVERRLNHFRERRAPQADPVRRRRRGARPGEIVILTGPSGSGKTTLLTLIGALRAAQEGSLTVLGQELRGASERTLVSVRRQIGYIFQLHNLLDALTATQNVDDGAQRDSRLSRAAARARAREMLESVGLGDHAGTYPDQLSGGQKQRVAIARALAGRPRIILADEPTASLDRAVRARGRRSHPATSPSARAPRWCWSRTTTASSTSPTASSTSRRDGSRASPTPCGEHAAAPRHARQVEPGGGADRARSRTCPAAVRARPRAGHRRGAAAAST